MALALGQLLFYFFSKRNLINLLISGLGVFASIYLYLSVDLHTNASRVIINRIVTP